MKPEERGSKPFTSGASRERKEMRGEVLEMSHRIQAVEADTPIDPEDVGDLEIMKEQISFIGTMSQIGNREHRNKESEKYRFPETREEIFREENGELRYRIDVVNKFKEAAAFAELRKDGVLDFREQESKFLLNESGRIGLDDNDGLSYDSERMILAILAASGDDHKDTFIIPYPHFSKESGIKSKTILVMNGKQKEDLRKMCIEQVLKILK